MPAWAAACALALLLATPAWSEVIPSPVDVQSIGIRELGRVTESPPVMGVISPQETQAAGFRLQASGEPQESGVGSQESGKADSERRQENPISAKASDSSPAPAAAVAQGASFKKKHGKKRLAEKYDVTKIGDRNVGHGLDLYSLKSEQRLGKQMAAEVEQRSRLVRDPVITEYVNRIGQTLVRNSDARVPFVIKVIDNDEVNAFALPGGYFYVNSGLILAAENEAELAGVMAHEIAHVAARHATKNATRQQLLNLATIPLIFVGGPAAYAVRQFMGLAIPMTFLKFSRNAEREADLLGLEYQYASGYDPEEFVRFFEKLHKGEKKQKHGFLAKAFATHPMTGDRIKRAQEEIAKYLPPKDEYIVDTSDFDAVKARLEKIENANRIDGGAGIHPTLRRREPEADSGRPRLERKNQ